MFRPPVPAWTRRRLLAAAAACATGGVCRPSRAAGPQDDAALADAVRTALSAAAAGDDPPRLDGLDEDARRRFLAWRAETGQRLGRRLSDPVLRDELLVTAWYESRRAGLDTALVLGLIDVESGFRKYAISAAGARGYMQVMPFWSRAIGDGNAGRLFHAQVNLRFGCTILRHYLACEGGDLFLALGRYNGSRGRAAYPQIVLARRARWA